MKLITLLAMAWLAVTSGGNLATSDGTPFFWRGSATWSMPRKMTSENIDRLLEESVGKGFNAVQIELVDELPSVNVYGQKSGTEAYWKLIDQIVEKAEKNGIYVGLSCLNRDLVAKDRISDQLAVAYAGFLAGRYGDKSNIVWLMDGDSGVWETLSESLRSADARHAILSTDDLREIQGRRDAYRTAFNGGYGICCRPEMDIDGLTEFGNLLNAFAGSEPLPSDDSIVQKGEGEDEVLAVRGSDCIIAYTWNNSEILLDLGKVSGERKHAFWYSPETGTVEDAGEYKSLYANFKYSGPEGPGYDHVLIVVDWKSCSKVQNLKKMTGRTAKGGILKLFGK